MKIKITKKELFIDYIPAILVGIVIVIFAIINKQNPIATLPTLISLAVMIMSARANRYAFLVGAGNCVLYTIAYITNSGTYFSAASAFLISMPIQIFSFFVWQKHKTDKTRSELIRLKWWQLLLVIAAIFPAWAGCYFGISKLIGGNQPLIDSLNFVLGIVISVLVAFRFIEGQYLNVLSCILAIGMWIAISIKEPNNINFVIISAYNIFRTVQAAVTWTSIYVKNNKNKNFQKTY
jgi:nicotinamide mononucleotide transporter